MRSRERVESQLPGIKAIDYQARSGPGDMKKIKSFEKIQHCQNEINDFKTCDEKKD
jgi:hypothetical protein